MQSDVYLSIIIVPNYAAIQSKWQSIKYRSMELMIKSSKCNPIRDMHLHGSSRPETWSGLAYYFNFSVTKKMHLLLGQAGLEPKNVHFAGL